MSFSVKLISVITISFFWQAKKGKIAKHNKYFSARFHNGLNGESLGTIRHYSISATFIHISHAETQRRKGD